MSKTKRFLRSSAPRASSVRNVWEVAVVRPPATTDPQGDYEIVLIAEKGTGIIRMCDFGLAPLEDEHIAAAVLQAAAAPIIGAPARALGRIEVASTRVGRAIAPVADALGADVLVRDSSADLERFTDLLPALRLPRIEHGFAGVEHCSADFLRAAEALAALMPWTVLDERDLLELAAHGAPLTHPIACVIGAAGECRGVVLHRSVEELDAAVYASDFSTPDVNLYEAIALWFLEPGEVPQGARRVYARLGYGRLDVYPRAIRVVPGEEPRDLDASEQRTLIVALRALVPFLSRHMRSLSDAATPPAMVVPGSPDVTVRSLAAGRVPLVDEDHLCYVNPMPKCLLEYAPGFPFDLSERDVASAPEAIAAIVLRMRMEPARRHASILQDIDEVRFSKCVGTCHDAYSMMAYSDGEPLGDLGPTHLDDDQIQGMRGAAFAWRGRGMLVFASGGTQRRVTRITNTDLVAAWKVKLTFT